MWKIQITEKNNNDQRVIANEATELRSEVASGTEL